LEILGTAARVLGSPQLLVPIALSRRKRNGEHRRCATAGAAQNSERAIAIAPARRHLRQVIL
jgi:hypothetical protein